MRRPGPLTSLQLLLEDCRVLVDGLTQGSGFFVAPGFVLTCAHVAGERVGDQVRLHWRGVDHEAVVLSASEANTGGNWSMWPYPDLAVLELPDPPADHPCVLLDEQSPWDGTLVTVAGFTNLLDDDVAAARSPVLTVGGRTFHHGHPLVELVAGEINLGLSGGPVLSHESGGVCAVVKATRQEHSAMGGFATPVDALRLLDPDVYRRVMTAHDRFHDGGDDQWSHLADRVETAGGEPDALEWPAARLSTAEGRRFRRLLADLPESGSCDRPAHAAAFLAAAPAGTPQPDLPLLMHRDVYAELAALIPPEADELPYELAYCADLARTFATGPAGKASAPGPLYQEVLLVAGRLGLNAQAPQRLACASSQAHLSSVIGRVRHSRRDRSLYQVMVWRYHTPHEIVPAAPESPALPLGEALTCLARLLTEQIDLMGGMSRPGLVELILPHKVLDEDFTDWKLWPANPFSTLGRKQYVVVRPLERQEDPGLQHAWEQRWSQLGAKTVSEALVCVCGRGRQRQETLDAAFNNDPALAALALAGSPRSGPVAQAYKVAVASGIPMMVWSRGAAPSPLPQERVCGIPGRDSCPVSEFLAQARRTLDGIRRDEVPARIRTVRNDALTDEVENHFGECVVLLWDDPTRQIPRTLLAPVPPAEEGRP
ncbi:VMAP-C domain-containing protein [Streptomyces lincolnensis]|uniref:VMAP-C domain-containing protein n=1 Tax=Streptomyces lincolnensis TaxID=1915 RepID=UPI0037D22244